MPLETEVCRTWLGNLTGKHARSHVQIQSSHAQLDNQMNKHLH